MDERSLKCNIVVAAMNCETNFESFPHSEPNSTFSNLSDKTLAGRTVISFSGRTSFIHVIELYIKY